MDLLYNHEYNIIADIDIIINMIFACLNSITILKEITIILILSIQSE